MIRESFKGRELALAIMFSLSCSSAFSKNGRGMVLRSPMKVAASGRRVTVTLAPAVEQALHRRFPGLHVADFGDFSPHVTSAATEAQPTLFVPFACVGDFDGNGAYRYVQTSD